MIGIDGYPLTRPLTGVGAYLFALLHPLVKEHPNYLFYLYVPSKNDILEQFLPYPNFRLRYLPYLSFSEALWSQSTLPLFLRKDRVDLFWSPTQSLPLFLPKKIKTLLSIHDFAYRLFPHTVAYGRGLYLRRLAPLFYKKAHKIIANSQGTAEKLEKLYQRKADGVLPPPLPPLSLPKMARQEHMITVATLEPRKNLIPLLRAYEKALVSVDLYPWIIVGNKGWRCTKIVAEIDRICRKYPHKLYYKGYVAEAEKYQLIASARYLVLCSHYEGYGIPLAEARCLGTPIVAFDQPEMREAAQSDGHFVKSIAEFIPYFKKEAPYPQVGPLSYPKAESGAQLLFQYMEHLLGTI